MQTVRHTDSEFTSILWHCHCIHGTGTVWFGFVRAALLPAAGTCVVLARSGRCLAGVAFSV